jgi:hypothetical protein
LDIFCKTHYPERFSYTWSVSLFSHVCERGQSVTWICCHMYTWYCHVDVNVDRASHIQYTWIYCHTFTWPLIKCTHVYTRGHLVVHEDIGHIVTVTHEQVATCILGHIVACIHGTIETCTHDIVTMHTFTRVNITVSTYCK